MTQVRAETSPVELQIDARDWSRLVVLSVLWGGTFFFTGVALKELPPLTLVFLRLSIASLILLPLLWINGIRFPAGVAGWRPYAVMAFIKKRHILQDPITQKIAGPLISTSSPFVASCPCL